jgi:hypothetical protein
MSDVWYYAEGPKTVGPISLAELGAILSLVSGATGVLVWRSGWSNWARAEDVKELAPFLIRPPPLPTPHTEQEPTTVGSEPTTVQSARFDSWPVAAGLTCTLWIAISFFLYGFVPALKWPIAVICASVAIAFFWKKKRKNSVGVIAGTALGLLLSVPIVDYRFDSEKAIALGFLTVGDMQEAARLGLTPNELAARRAEESAKAAVAKKLEQERQAALNACRADWSRCADNAEIANNYSRWFDVKYDCQREANSRARYGEPVWPSYSFGSFLSGKDFVTSGIAVAIEPDAQFQNGFGAKVHARVVCKYDLRTRRVIDVVITAR